MSLPESCRAELALLAEEGDFIWSPPPSPSPSPPPVNFLSFSFAAMDTYTWFLALNFIIFCPLSVVWCSLPFIPSSLRQKPTAVTQRNNEHALKLGYPLLLVRLMLCYQHLTIWTMLLTTMYLALSFLEQISYPDLGPTAAWARCAARHVLPGAAPIVAQFWTFIMFAGPWSLIDRRDFPKSEGKAKKLVAVLFYRPSFSFAGVFYLLMHIQHTWMPFLPFIEAMYFEPSRIGCIIFDEVQEYSIAHPSLGSQFLYVAIFLLSWLIWALFVWRARNNAPYPILRTVWLNGKWPVLYISMSAIGVIGVLISRALSQRQLPF